MGNHFAYTINGPEADATTLPVRLSKSHSVKREPKLSGNNLRNLYQNPAASPNHRISFSSTENGRLGPTTPILPPTPPNVDGDDDGVDDDVATVSEAAKNRSMLATPVNQISPPTPDNTPPREKSRLRPFLGAQPSMTSTRAESFKTAQEEIYSDKESNSSTPILRSEANHSLPFLQPYLTNGIHKPSPLASIPITNGDLTSKKSSPLLGSSAAMPGNTELSESIHVRVTNNIAQGPYSIDQVGNRSTEDEVITDPVGPEPSPLEDIKSKRDGAERGQSLRERLEESRQSTHSPSLDKFASIIGWSTGVHNSADNTRRWSAVSNTSTIEAVLIEQPHTLKKRNTLRHVSKNDSLRSISSPLPTSNRNSMQSSSDSPHRLVHKRAKLGNHNRQSFGSEMSRSLSISSNFVPKIEIIPVAIIPERSSSLQRSAFSSRRHSVSTAGAPTSFRMPRSSIGSQRQRSNTDNTSRGRDRHYPPQVPARSSSLSAPTSRSTSRRSSITSGHLSVEQKRAENDLRHTLNRMESERLVSSLRSASLDMAPMSGEIEDLVDNIHSDGELQRFVTVPEPSPAFATPGSKEWAELRPTSTLYTPFSQPSMMSASPEISEARMISLHVHNNHSVQLIEPFSLQESFAVGKARKLNQSELLYEDYIDSPLRNPRSPPAPPQFHFVPASPQTEALPQLRDQNMNPSTPPRPVTRTRTNSFTKSLLRSVSLKNARNKKADQDLDSSLHPFWRPRPFWDGIEGASPEKNRNREIAERGLVNNSLGLPQQRVIVSGPLGLVRKFSERRRNQRMIAKQASFNSLQRLRKGRQLYRLPGMGMQLHLLSFRDIQDKVVAVRQRKEDEKRERRREALRRSIGANVVATGDSRFPSAMVGT